MVGQTNSNTCRVTELNNQNKNVKSHKKILSKFVDKLLKYMKMFKDILTFLGLYYRDAPLITFYFVVLGISMPKIKSNE